MLQPPYTHAHHLKSDSSKFLKSTPFDTQLPIPLAAQDNLLQISHKDWYIYLNEHGKIPSYTLTPNICYNYNHTQTQNQYRCHPSPSISLHPSFTINGKKPWHCTLTDNSYSTYYQVLNKASKLALIDTRRAKGQKETCTLL